MDAHDVIQALRGSWRLIAAITLTCAVAATTYTYRSDKIYESHTQLFVASPDRDFSVQRVSSYARLVKSPYITAEIVRDLRLPGTGRDLAAKISASSPPGTVLINLIVPDADPARARQIGNAIANKMIEYVPSLERTKSTEAPDLSLSISSPPSLPKAQVSPNARLNVAAGIVLGLLLGMLTAIARRRLNRRISTPDDLPDGAGLGVLCAVPIDDANGGGKRPGVGAWSSGRAEAMRQLRTNLRFIAPHEPSSTILVVSSVAGEGTSTTALGLAMSMADAGSHVILMEANLRNPMLTSALKLPDSDGVAAYLSQANPGAPVLQRIYGGPAGGGLQVLVAGEEPTNPSELLSSPRMPELLEDLRGRCDMLLIDGPPLLSTTESAVLAEAANGVIVVLRVGGITRPELDRSLGILMRAGARLLGLVANGVAAGEWVKPRARSGRAIERAPAPASSSAPTPRLAAPPPAAVQVQLSSPGAAATPQGQAASKQRATLNGTGTPSGITAPSAAAEPPARPAPAEPPVRPKPAEPPVRPRHAEPVASRTPSVPPVAAHAKQTVRRLGRSRPPTPAAPSGSTAVTPSGAMPVKPAEPSAPVKPAVPPEAPETKAPQAALSPAAPLASPERVPRVPTQPATGSSAIAVPSTPAASADPPPPVAPSAEGPPTPAAPPHTPPQVAAPAPPQVAAPPPAPAPPHTPPQVAAPAPPQVAAPPPAPPHPPPAVPKRAPRQGSRSRPALRPRPVVRPKPVIRPNLASRPTPAPEQDTTIMERLGPPAPPADGEGR